MLPPGDQLILKSTLAGKKKKIIIVNEKIDYDTDEDTCSTHNQVG